MGLPYTLYSVLSWSQSTLWPSTYYIRSTLALSTTTQIHINTFLILHAYARNVADRWRCTEYCSHSCSTFPHLARPPDARKIDQRIHVPLLRSDTHAFAFQTLQAWFAVTTWPTLNCSDCSATRQFVTIFLSLDLFESWSTGIQGTSLRHDHHWAI